MNHLADETSAYLQQHQNNPVDWYPWSAEALERAQAEDRPLLVSIGYSACHWCHVMERESFEDEETAALMNRLFINIKVDREERPDIDQIYMDTVVRLTGHGGWPLTVFCMPDGRPFYGGTYYPPEPRHGMPAFRQVLESVEHAYRSQRAEVEKSAGSILEALSEHPRGVANALPGAKQLAEAAEQLLSNADTDHGGFGSAPKFPTPTNLDLLLAAVDVLPAERSRAALDHVVFTCREMSRGGLFDHIGGGFHRYCVDADWVIPHFEKMLYDQGLLLRSFAETLRRTDLCDASLRWPITETVEYLRREMLAPDGGFFASQDADSEGEEGKFYVFTPAELRDILGEERAASFADAYGVSEIGNFEHGTSQLRQRPNLDRNTFTNERLALRKARAARIPPATDRKRLTSWNGYAVSGLARAGSLLEDEAMLADAVAVADFLLERMTDENNQLLRVYNEEKRHTSAFLDDHAALLDGLLDLYRAGAGERFLESGLGIAESLVERFFDANENDFFLTPADGERLVHRPRSDHDGATPHSCGLASLGLLRAATLSGRPPLLHAAEATIRTHAFVLERVPHAYPTLLRAATLAERGSSVAVVIGEEADPQTRRLAQRARQVLTPDDAVVVVAPGAPTPTGIDATWLLGREPVDGKPTAFICHGTTCSLPITDPSDFEA